MNRKILRELTHTDSDRNKRTKKNTDAAKTQTNTQAVKQKNRRTDTQADRQIKTLRPIKANRKTNLKKEK